MHYESLSNWRQTATDRDSERQIDTGNETGNRATTTICDTALKMFKVKIHSESAQSINQTKIHSKSTYTHAHTQRTSRAWQRFLILNHKRETWGNNKNDKNTTITTATGARNVFSVLIKKSRKRSKETFR